MLREPSTGKPRFDLLIPEGVPYEDQLITRVANLMGKAASGKYKPRNWEKANSKEELDRMYESAFRHFMQWYCGMTDEDHAAGLIFNVLAVENTRPKVQELNSQPANVELIDINEEQHSA